MGLKCQHRHFDGLPISEHVSQAENLVIAKRMEVQKVRHVNVFHAELIRFSAVMSTASLIIVNLDSLYFKSNVSMLNTTVKLGVSVNEIHGCNMVRNKRKNFFFGFLINNRCSIRIVVLLKTESYDSKGSQ